MLPELDCSGWQSCKTPFKQSALGPGDTRTRCPRADSAQALWEFVLRCRHLIPLSRLHLWAEQVVRGNGVHCHSADSLWHDVWPVRRHLCQT